MVQNNERVVQFDNESVQESTRDLEIICDQDDVDDASCNYEGISDEVKRIVDIVQEKLGDEFDENEAGAEMVFKRK